MAIEPDYFDPNEYDIESPEFVLRLQMKHAGAWRKLEEYADSQLVLGIYKACLDASLPLELADEFKASIWLWARREIGSLHFKERGDVFKWLDKLNRRLQAIYQNMESDDFILLLAGQDHGAWSLLFQTYYRNLYLSALAHLTARLPRAPIGKNEQDAESIVHQTWEVARRRIDTFKHPSSALLAWILAIVKNLTLNHIRREKFRRHVQLDDIEETVSVQRATIHLDGEDVDVEQVRAVLEEAMAELLKELPNSAARDQVFRRIWEDEKLSDIHRSYPKSDYNALSKLCSKAKVRLKQLILEIQRRHVSGDTTSWRKLSIPKS